MGADFFTTPLNVVQEHHENAILPEHIEHAPMIKEWSAQHSDDSAHWKRIAIRCSPEESIANVFCFNRNCLPVSQAGPKF
jgi:hypothetical protein